MPLNFFESGVKNGMIQLPNEKIRDLQQAAISEKWDATTAKIMVQEQNNFGTDSYHDIEVWVDYATEMTTRGLVNGDDFRKLLFESIDHPVKKGLYYRFDENTWITYFTDKYSSLNVDIGVRRCNNVMKIVDPQNGSIFCIPCVVDYDITAASMQVANAVLTPNSHAIIKVQGNNDTHRLFKLNTRYILGGRPFKLLAYQNTLIDKELSDKSTYLELDLFLDELHAEDDIENQLAYNGTYDYDIQIDSHDMSLTSGSIGSLNASITLNGEEVNRKVIWESTSPDVVEINENGEYNVIGTEGQSAIIIATLDGNEAVSSSIAFNVVPVEQVKPKIVIDPAFDKVHEYETIEFDLSVNYGSKNYSPESSSISLSKDEEKFKNDFISIEKNDNHYSITGERISKESCTLYINVNNAEPEFVAEYELPIKVVSFMD